MADKMTCPGCDSHTSSVLAAYRNGDPCPYCGLDATTMDAVLRVRRSQADAAIRAEAESATLRAIAAEAEAARLRAILDQIMAAVDRAREEQQP